MIVVPAAGLGVLAILLAAFAAGFGTMQFLFHLTRSKQNLLENNRGLLGFINRLTEETINAVSIIFGAMVASLSLVLLLEYTSNSKNSSKSWLILILIGFIASALWFVFLSIVSSDGNGARTTRTGYSENTEVEDLDEIRRKAEAERQKYLNLHYRKIQNKRKSIAVFINNWINVFSRVHTIGDICRRHFLRRLANSLNDLITLSNIKVIEPLENPGNDKNEDVRNSIFGIIEIDGKLILLTIISSKGLLGRKGISPFIVQLYNRSLPNMIVYADSSFEDSAHSTCKEVTGSKVIALCNLTELSATIAGKGSLKAYFLGKVSTKAERE